MYCSVCGHQNNDDAEKCEICSSVLNPAGADSTQPKQPMKWIKFLIYFSYHILLKQTKYDILVTIL